MDTIKLIIGGPSWVENHHYNNTNYTIDVQLAEDGTVQAVTPPDQQKVTNAKSFWGNRAIAFLVGSAASGAALAMLKTGNGAIAAFALTTLGVRRFWQTWSQHSLWNQNPTQTVESRRAEAEKRGFEYIFSHGTNDPFAHNKCVAPERLKALYLEFFRKMNQEYTNAASSWWPNAQANFVERALTMSPLREDVKEYAKLSDEDKAKFKDQNTAFNQIHQDYTTAIVTHNNRQWWIDFSARLFREPEPSEEQKKRESEEDAEARGKQNGVVAAGSLSASFWNWRETNNKLTQLFDQLKPLHEQAYAALTAPANG